MNEASTHTPKLIPPSGTQRRLAVLPDWFLHNQNQNTRAGHSFCLLLSDSYGENFEDLLAAWCLRMKHSDNAHGESSIAKCYANEMARDVTGKALQLMGGYGYSKSFPIEQKMRLAWGWGIAGGSINVQKTNIASALVGRRFNQRAK